MIRIATAALAAFLVAAPAYAAEPPKGPVSIKAVDGAKQGPVKFDHANHAPSPGWGVRLDYST